MPDWVFKAICSKCKKREIWFSIVLQNMTTSVLEVNQNLKYNQQIVNLLHIILLNLQELQDILSQINNLKIMYPSINTNTKC